MTECGPHHARSFGLGTPTEYGFRLPQLRHDLALANLAGTRSRLLDFGCGNGANTALFAADCGMVVGVDVLAEHLRAAVTYIRNRRLANVRYLRYDGTTLPFRAGTFDSAVSFEVLEHTADDVAALREIRRVLTPEGTLTLSVPNKWYLMETHGFDLPPRAVKWNRVPLLSWLPTPIHERHAHARIYSRERIDGVLARAGFEVVSHRYLMPPFDRVDHDFPRRILRFVFDLIGSSPLRVLGVAHFIVARPATAHPRPHEDGPV